MHFSGAGSDLGVSDLGTLDATTDGDTGLGTVEQVAGVIGCLLVFLGLLSCLLLCLAKGKKMVIFFINGSSFYFFLMKKGKGKEKHVGLVWFVHKIVWIFKG